jgi:ribosomal protein S18 acetylase RimI-like enzyme
VTVTPVEVRPAVAADAPMVAKLAGQLAQSFEFVRTAFDASYAAVLGDPEACLLVAVHSGECVGYVLGSHHPTFHASGPAARVEEVVVREGHRGRGIGRALMVVTGSGRTPRRVHHAVLACTQVGRALR